MKITKQRLKEIIKEEIKDFKSEQKLRKQIRELSGGSTSLGAAQKKGYKSKGRKAAQSTSDADASDYSTSKAYHNTRSSEYASKATDFTTKSNVYSKKSSAYTQRSAELANVANAKFRKANRRAVGGYDYSGTQGRGYSLNPVWTTKSNARTTASTEKATALTQKNAAEAEKVTALAARTKASTKMDTDRSKSQSSLARLKTAKETDLKATVPKVKPPAAGGAGFGKGKAAGKGKGKKGGKKGDEQK